VAHKYFAWLETQGYEDLSVVGANEIRNYLLFASKQYSQNSMRSVKLYLSKLYSHLYEAGLAETSYQQLLSFSVQYDVKIGLPPHKDDIAKMLDAIDRKTVSGKRAYAAMMLGIVLGLRAADVANLKLTDIDWQNGKVKILQTKTAKSVVLPLTRDVGEALSDYILNGRLQSESKQVFLRLQRPYNGISGAVTIGEIYHDCCVTAGLTPSKRFHNLRRALGTSMVNAGVAVTTAAQVFGDVNIDPMKQYIAVDLEHLKLCALPFDGIATKGGAAI
jgi:integrase